MSAVVACLAALVILQGFVLLVLLLVGVAGLRRLGRIEAALWEDALDEPPYWSTLRRMLILILVVLAIVALGLYILRR